MKSAFVLISTLFILGLTILYFQLIVPETKDSSMNSIQAIEQPAQPRKSVQPKQFGKNLEERFREPSGFKRVPTSSGTFAQYLKTRPLKPVGSPVMLYNGQKKRNQVHEAVFTIDVGKRDLQQCADAIMRLRAEYLFEQKKYEQIGFHFTNGFWADYKTWRNGKRIKVDGNQVNWTNSSRPDTSYNGFRKYLEQVFIYAGTLSLSKELKSVSIDDLSIGNVFIQGGSPGHAVLVVDVAIHEESGEKVFMLAQSYMPAQEIHILKNLQNPEISPWYKVKETSSLFTPEWTFDWNNLKKFEN